MSHIKLREYLPSDESFIYNSWLKSAKDDHPEMTNTNFFAAYKDHVTELMKKNTILVACDPTDDSFIHGYMVFNKVDEFLIIHWAYVKSPFRKLGVFKKMIESVFTDLKEKPIIITYKNDKRKHMFESLKMIFKPEYRSLKL